MADNHDHKSGEHKHHILSNKTSLRVLLFLLFFTVVTVAASQMDFGSLNFPLAMAIATMKSAVVMWFFMGLKYDNTQNRTIFLSGYAFLLMFILFIITDFFSRAPGQMNMAPIFKQATGGPSFDKAWIVTPEILARGKEVYKAQACASCHGEGGYGDGPAGKALKARNYHVAEGWKNGRKPSQVFQTLSKGLNSMPAFADLTPSDRWAVAHFVLAFGPPPPADDVEDLKKIGVDPTQEGGGKEAPKKTIPIDFAMERYTAR